MKNKLLLSIGVFCLIAIIVAVIMMFFMPRSNFQKTFGIELPSESEIVRYKKTADIENHFYMKVKLNKEDYINFMKKMDYQFSEYKVSKSDYSKIPYMKTACSWWDMNNNEIDTYFSRMIVGKRVKTINQHIFFTKNSQGEYYVYISA